MVLFYLYFFFLKKIIPSEIDDRVQDSFSDENLLSEEMLNSDEIEIEGINNERRRLTRRTSTFAGPKISLKGFFSSPKILFAGMSASFAYFMYAQLEPVFAIRLTEFNLSQLSIGLFYAIFPVVYVISGLTIQYFPKWIDRRVFLISALAINTVAFLLNGPS